MFDNWGWLNEQQASTVIPDEQSQFTGLPSRPPRIWHKAILLDELSARATKRRDERWWFHQELSGKIHNSSESIARSRRPSQKTAEQRLSRYQTCGKWATQDTELRTQGLRYWFWHTQRMCSAHLGAAPKLCIEYEGNPDENIPVFTLFTEGDISSSLWILPFQNHTFHLPRTNATCCIITNIGHYHLVSLNG